jgi:hypothetical protein
MRVMRLSCHVLPFNFALLAETEIFIKQNEDIKIYLQ